MSFGYFSKRGQGRKWRMMDRISKDSAEEKKKVEPKH